ncbi:MAG: hypothetical protein PVJ57_17755 [Phycisphaerae bacterium]|jgi:hypothetical protein
MAEARSRGEWARASALMMTVANCHRGPKTRPFEPSDFDPYAKSDEREVSSMAELKPYFVDDEED